MNFENTEENWDLDDLKLIDELLKDSLKQDFSVSIPDDFADFVTEKVEKQKSVREALLRLIMMTLGYLGIPGIAFGLLYYLKSTKIDVILDLIFTYKYPVLFGVLCILSIQIADVLLLSRTKDQLDK
ncbi:hypothetical protein BZG02_00510 [Labilibaculum filiforme]|uniref:Uncharacterized protein n=1 Tax=Labilibaculum filiforme TaxID=1940526 RepID=A0A2N3I5E5_9BACT|nr:hypothetical protein [Labilibaculum filiforme]PKQ65522.1 hypothetical protein BZG02_00510 [Labilibaculum filiforme]